MAKKKKKAFYEYSSLQQLLPSEFLGRPNPFYFLLENISYKHFFSSLLRTINEEPRIHNYDVQLSSFELKIGFGGYQPTSVLSDHYYFYAILAHLNGYITYTPSKIISFVQMIMLAHFAKQLEQDKLSIELFIETISLWLTAFLYQYKCIPQGELGEDFRWCIESFFQLRNTMISRQEGGIPISDTMKQSYVASSLEYFFFLSHAAKHCSQYCPYGKQYQGLEQYLLRWKHIFSIEHSQEVLSHYYEQFLNPVRSLAELTLLSQSVHKESYLYGLIKKYPNSIATYFFAKLFPDSDLKKLFLDCMYNKVSFYEVITQLMHPDYLKKHFLVAVRHMGNHLHQKNYDGEASEELHDFLEGLQKGSLSLLFEIPESLRKESEFMNIVFHFYLHMMITCFQYTSVDPKLFDDVFFDSGLGFATDHYLSDEKVLLESLLQQYNACSFYYEQAYTKILSGLERFTLPLIPTSKLLSGDSKVHVYALYRQHFAILLQDIGVKKYSSQHATVSECKLFQSQFGKAIASGLVQQPEKLFDEVYATMLSKAQIDILSKQTHTLTMLKESFYQLDFWVWHEMIQYLIGIPELKTIENSMIKIISYAIIRQTILGILIFWGYIDKVSYHYEKRTLLLDIVGEILVRDVWFLPFATMRKVLDHLQYLLNLYYSLLEPLLKIEETQKMCSIGYQSIQLLLESSKPGEIINIGHEDVVRFREYLKHIQYFSNKTYKPSL